MKVDTLFTAVLDIRKDNYNVYFLLFKKEESNVHVFSIGKDVLNVFCII